jgi:hypothetical protein
MLKNLAVAIALAAALAGCKDPPAAQTKAEADYGQRVATERKRAIADRAAKKGVDWPMVAGGVGFLVLTFSRRRWT